MLRQISEILLFPQWKILENLSFAICKTERLKQRLTYNNINPGVLKIILELMSVQPLK